MPPVFLPLVVDAPACDRPRPSDPPTEPFVLHLRTENGDEIFLPMTLAAVQAIVQLLDPEVQES